MEQNRGPDDGPSEENPTEENGETRRVIIELRAPAGPDALGALMSEGIELPGVQIDPDYQPVSVPPQEGQAQDLTAANEQVVLIRGTLQTGQEASLEADPRVVRVWSDARIEPFQMESDTPPDLSLSPSMAACPCEPCDCDSSPTGAKGDRAAVASFTGADRVWARGYRGNGIEIGICDTGVRRSAVPQVIGGWSPPGTLPWGDDRAQSHGTMCSIDALTTCPDARIVDIGILKSAGGIAGLLSDAIAAYDWALDRYHRTGGPQVLSNSWGIFQENWGPDYARDPNHPFTRKVVEAINAGILVCFAAGNCGEVCPYGRCGSDSGPGRDIWGANGHPPVVTVGAANVNEHWIGYSSQGPAALTPRKPDICGISHFRGFTANDNGTSAACPTVAGVLGLLRQARPNIRQAEAKFHLQATAKNICAGGWDRDSGYGIKQAEAAVLRALRRPAFPFCGVQWRGRVPANSSVRWFTFNWPAYWHLVWTVVPTSPRPGGPQIRQRVQIERADGDHLTYWITVTNMTPAPVDIEGRYCVMGA